MTKTASIILSVCAAAGVLAAQSGKPSPAAEASVTINGKMISVKYSAPSMRGRKIFGDGGIVSKDPTYPVWRAGANAATTLVTAADLDINGLHVPAGTYTIFAQVNEEPWMLIVSKKTGEWGLAYDQGSDLGRVKMMMSKPSAPIETFKILLDHTGGNKGKLTLQWENVVASVPFTVQ